jgi:hypothetical protein
MRSRIIRMFGNDVTQTHLCKHEYLRNGSPLTLGSSGDVISSKQRKPQYYRKLTLKSIVIKNNVFWDSMSCTCSIVVDYSSFGATYCPHLQSRRISRSREQSTPENGSSMFLRNDNYLLRGQNIVLILVYLECLFFHN